MRCLALVEGLLPYATDVHFVCRKLPGDLCRLIERKGFRCTLLPVDPVPEAQLPVEQAGADPPLDQAIDARQTASQTGAVDWLIVDHYEIDHRWELAMRSTCSRLLVIDDLAKRSHDCDILLDQTYGRQAEQYGSLVGKQCNILAGTGYALLRPEFAEKRTAVLARRSQVDGIGSVLISMGGSDPSNRSLDALRVIAGTTGSETLDVTVITGPQYAGNNASLRLMGDRFDRLDLKHDVPNMAELMAASDLAIGAAGTTSWERCCLGLPALVYVCADNQREVARRLEAAGAIRCWRSGAELQEEFEIMTNDASLYQSAVAASSGICDGLGVERVTAAMRS